MAEARERSEWSRSSTLLCLIASGFAGLGGKRKRYKPEDFNPFSGSGAGEKKRISVAEFGQLMFGNRARKPEKATVKRDDSEDHAAGDVPPGDRAGDPDPVDDSL